MVSEIENLEKGIVVSTIEYDANKRIIGIGTPTITPNPATGIAPLSKQTAFVPEVKESLAEVAEKVLGTNPNQAVPIQEPTSGQPKTIPTPTLNDSISTEAVNVEIPTDLGNLSTVKEVAEPIKNSIAEITKSIPAPTEAKVEVPEIAVPVAEPVATPQEVLATEPTGVNEQLFASAPAPTENTIEVPTESIAAVTSTIPPKSVAPIAQTVPVEPLNNTANVASEPTAPAPLSFEPRTEIKPLEAHTEEITPVPFMPLNTPNSPDIEQQVVAQQTSKNSTPILSTMNETEKQEMAKKLASIVSSIISSKVTEIAYNASYEEFMGLLNEMSKNKNLEKEDISKVETATNDISPMTLENPMLSKEIEPTMRLAA